MNDNGHHAPWQQNVPTLVVRRKTIIFGVPKSREESQIVISNRHKTYGWRGSSLFNINDN
jgi:hypothetical protein